MREVYRLNSRGKVMAFRPKDQIDMMIVQKYASEKMDSCTYTGALINPNDMMCAMRDYAEVQRNFMVLNNKLKDLCHNVSSKAAAYKASRIPQKRVGA